MPILLRPGRRFRRFVAKFDAARNFARASIVLHHGTATDPDSPSLTMDINVLSAWLDYSAFEIDASIFDEVGVHWDNSFLQISIGENSGRPPSGLSGTATWEGSMVAVDTRTRHQVVGASTVQLDLARIDVDIRMTDVWDIEARAHLSSFDWRDLPISAGGTFGNGETVMGSFYGPNHEEVGGIFTTSRLIGAFGATEQ